jgi:hypothetical protein
MRAGGGKVMKHRSDHPRGRGCKLDYGDLDVDDLASKQHDANPTTITPMLY